MSVAVAFPPAQHPRTPSPLVLAPAGDWDCAKAAVENGADAIYFGVGRFNARARAANFTGADLPKLTAWLHQRGVRAYVTFNTLVFQDELAAARDAIRAFIAAGVDATIVQDAGACRLIREISPDFPIHASTQMTVTNSDGIEFARELGASLVVLARECSIAEIEKIHAAAVRPGVPPVALEVFIHGALCVAYSGQCLTSEALGGRSANRGECAQACRLPYELICDGQLRPLGDRRYLLSPRDLAGMEALPELIRAGVSSLKIEGRLKSPEYVSAITRAYRVAVDRVMISATTAAATLREFNYDLKMSFSRGLGEGWLRGINNRRLVHARFGKKRGVFLGEILEVGDGCVRIRAAGPLKPGDGCVFDAGKPEEDEEGGFIYGVSPQRDGTTWVRFARECSDWRRIRPGQILWKTSDPELTRRLRASYAGYLPRFRHSIRARVSGVAGGPLRVEFTDAEGRSVVTDSAVPLVPAEKQGLSEEFLRMQLGRLGGTPHELGALELALAPGLMLPVTELNRMRRSLVEKLDALRAVPPRRTSLPDADATRANTDNCGRTREGTGSELPAAAIIPFLRLPSQLDVALHSGARTLYCEFEDLAAHKKAVNRVHEFSADTGTPVEIWVTPPRIIKEGETPLLDLLAKSGADGWLVRNHAQLHHPAPLRRRGDFSLNVANARAAAWFIEHYNLERLTASYDLNATQLDALLCAAPPAWFEVTIHQHIPMFHMEHCVFCAFLSPGKDFHDCGRPCEAHTVRLRDRTGMEHLLRADAGCRNTLYNGRAQTGAEFAEGLLALGVRHFRVEFVDESPAVVEGTLGRYTALLRGELSGSQLWRDLRLSNQLGVTRGTMIGKPL